MKIGVSLPSYYEEYLKKIANLNDLPITTVCGLILENFLSFNKNNKRFPLFRKQVRIVYDENISQVSLDSDRDNSDSCDLGKNSKSLTIEDLRDILREDQVADIEIHDDDWLPF